MSFRVKPALTLAFSTRRSNTANETMVEDYVQSHLAGNPVFKRGKDGHAQTLSCFDKTKPVSPYNPPATPQPASPSFPSLQLDPPPPGACV